MQRCFYHEGLVGGNGFLGGGGGCSRLERLLEVLLPPSSAMRRCKAFANNVVRESNTRDRWGIHDQFSDSMGLSIIPFIRCR
jgi:hypothetical protein